MPLHIVPCDIIPFGSRHESLLPLRISCIHGFYHILNECATKNNALERAGCAPKYRLMRRSGFAACEGRGALKFCLSAAIVTKTHAPGKDYKRHRNSPIFNDSREVIGYNMRYGFDMNLVMARIEALLYDSNMNKRVGKIPARLPYMRGRLVKRRFIPCETIERRPFP